MGDSDTRPISVEEALGLSRQFSQAAMAIGDYLYDERVWPNLPEVERSRLRSLQVTLFNLATDMVTEAGGVVLRNAAASIAQLGAATREASDAIRNIRQVGHALGIAGALIGLAAAIPSGSMAAILGAADGVRGAVDQAREALAAASPLQGTAAPTGRA